MTKSYLGLIKANIGIYATKKTSNILDGSYKSIYKGSGLNFEDLREYIPGDNVRDIDWKASSRSRTVLVKRHITEKKHNIMLVFDNGKKMRADTKCGECKKDVALMCGGLIGYLADKNSDNVGALYEINGNVSYFQLKTGAYNLERILAAYNRDTACADESNLLKTLEFMVKNIRRRMIVFIITDELGLKNIPEAVLKKIRCQHDVICICVGDADVTGRLSYNMDEEKYVPGFISRNKKLMAIEQKMKEDIKAENDKKLIRQRIVCGHIDSSKNAVNEMIQILERHKYANIN